MKSKNNLELFKNEIIYNLEHGEYKSLYDVLYAIYVREGPAKVTTYKNILDWFADVPRETLELDEYSYHLINEYYSVLLEEAIIDFDSKPLEWFIIFKTLIRMNIIPSRYSKMPLKEFIKIIRLKEDKK